MLWNKQTRKYSLYGFRHPGRVSGNEEADKLAKQVMAREIIDMQIGYSKSEIKSIIKREIKKN